MEIRENKWKLSWELYGVQWKYTEINGSLPWNLVVRKP